MNQKVKDIGCYHTHFTNPHGYHDENHYTTAYDMALIFQYCLKNEDFKEIIGTVEKNVKAANTDRLLKLRNSNRMMDKRYTKMYEPYMQGGKTGYTPEAKGTFIGYATKGEKSVIVGTFGGSQNINGNQGRFLDAKTLLNYSFENFTNEKLFDATKYEFKIYDDKNNKCYTLKPQKDLYGLINNTTPNITYKIQIDYEKLTQKISEQPNFKDDSIVGTLHLNYHFYDNTATVNTKMQTNLENDLILVDITDYYSLSYLKKYIPLIIAIIFLLILILLIKMLIQEKTHT